MTKARTIYAFTVALLAFGAAGALSVQTGSAGAQPPVPGFSMSGVAQTTSTTNVDRGKTVYTEHCAECHGAEGKGDGAAAHLLLPRPRDFTYGRYKIRTTDTGSVPTDDDLLRTVRQGVYGSAMPGWDGLLSDADIRDVIAFIKSFSERFAAPPPQAVPVPGVSTAPSDSVTRGQVVYAKLQCGKCHGIDGRGTNATATKFEDDWGFPLRAADLTEPWTFHGGATAQDVYMRFRVGMSGTPMPSYKESATEAEMLDLANFVVALARKPVWEMNAEEVTAFYARQEAEARANPAKRGEYLVDTLGCPLCHSPLDDGRRLIPGLKLAGGMRIRVEPFGVYPTGNLTSDKETGLGSWTDAEIKQTITRGILKDGTRLLPYPMDWPSFASLKPADLDAIVAYLRTLPPVKNKVPRPSRTFLPLYLWGKFQMLILGGDPPMTFYAGNAGNVGTGGGQQ